MVTPDPASKLDDTLTKNPPPSDESLSYSHLSIAKNMIINALPMMIYLISVYITFLANIHFAGAQSDSYFLDAVGFSNTLFTMALFGVVVGLNNGLFVVCSQAFGAKNYKLLGYYYHRGIIIILIIYIISIIILLNNQFYLGLSALPQVTQDYIHDIILCASPGLLFFGLFDVMRAYLIANGIYYPQFVVQTTFSLMHILWVYIFVDYLNLKAQGIGISLTITYTFIALSTYGYVSICKPTKKSWFWFTKDSFKGLWNLFKLEIPIGAVTYLEWIAFEIAVIFSTLYTADQMAAQVTIYNIMTMFSVTVSGFCIVCNQNLGKAIGSKDLFKLRRVYKVSFGILLAILLIEEIILLCLTQSIAGFFASNSNEMDITLNGLYVCAILVLPFDSLQNLFSAYLRSIGLAKKASIFFCTCYYLIGLPLAFLFGNRLGYYVNGLWMGLGIGVICMCMSSCIIILRTDLEAQAIKVEERLKKDKEELISEIEQASLLGDEDDKAIRKEEVNDKINQIQNP